MKFFSSSKMLTSATVFGLAVGLSCSAIAETVQKNAGWGLRVMGEAPFNTSQSAPNEYRYTNTGAGQIIYVLGSGLNLDNPNVAKEFSGVAFDDGAISFAPLQASGRASVIFDVNNGTGNDCNGIGTKVASAAASNTYGIAKGATVRMVKVTEGCRETVHPDQLIYVVDWLADNAKKGSIINFARPFGTNVFRTSCGTSWPSRYTDRLDSAVKKAHDAGLIVVIPAGEGKCDTKDYSLTNLPESFVVGSIMNVYGGIPLETRIGQNVSTYSPGPGAALMDQNGNPVSAEWINKKDYLTSYSAGYMAGVFAVACEYTGQFCSTISNGTQAYTTLKNASGVNVRLDRGWKEEDDLPAGYPKRFIWQQF